MGFKQITVCDRCGAECKWDAFTVVTGTQEKPAEAKTENREERIDLCDACLRSITIIMLDNWSNNCQFNLMDWMKEARKKPILKRV